MSAAFAPAELTLATVLAQPPTLGAGRLLCIDGPSGAGKTTFADQVGGLHPAAHVVHMDDLYQGWRGLLAGIDQLEGLVTALATGAQGKYRRWDWHRDDWAEQHTVDPVALIVVEGVGAGCAAIAHRITTLVWLDAEADLRLARVLARDGEAVADHLRDWQRSEAAYFAADQPRNRADLVLDTDG